jgi:glutathione S-transferase
MLSFPAEIARAQGRTGSRPKLAAFVEAVHARPTWKASLEKGGAYNFA